MFAQKQDMVKKVFIALFLASTALLGHQAFYNKAHSNSFGAPFSSGRGYTNSPFDGRNCTSCHVGRLNVGPGEVEIITDIPDEGYRAGNTYAISAKITQTGINRFGFQMTSENEDHNKAGRFTANSQTRAQSDFYITQGTSSSSSAGTNTKTWTFNWTAPEQVGTGPIQFYAAFNAANNNGQSSGDNIYTKTLVVQESLFSGIENETTTAAITLYPNPASDFILFSWNTVNLIAAPAYYTITNTHGTTIKSEQISLHQPNATQRIELSALPPGLYFLNVSQGSQQESRKFLLH